MTHVLGSSAEARRNEWLKWTVLANSRRWQCVWSLLLASKVHNNFNLRNMVTVFYFSLSSSWFLASYTGKICTALHFARYGTKSLKWPVMGASTLHNLLLVDYCVHRPRSLRADLHTWARAMRKNNDLEFLVGHGWLSEDRDHEKSTSYSWQPRSRNMAESGLRLGRRASNENKGKNID